MTQLFKARDTLTAARIGASEASDTCPMCGYDHEAPDLAQTHYAADPTLAEAESHYGKRMCCTCFEDLTACAVCNTKRRQTEMTAVGYDDAHVCSAYCEGVWNEPSIATDNRLTLGDVM